MATKTINQFGVITTLATNDKLPLWQNSSAATKAVTYGNFITQVIASLTLSDYVKKDGTVALTGDWDIGSGRYIAGDKIRARSASGLRLEDDSGALGIFIEDGGQVGIGAATAPAYSLDVLSAAGVQSILRAGQSGVSNGLTIASDGTVLTHVFNGGNVGVGNTAPAALLHVGAGADVPTTTPTIYASLAGAVSIVARDSTNNIEARITAGTTNVIMGAVTNHALALHTNNTQRAVILAGGNVGIGAATTPTHLFDVLSAAGAQSIFRAGQSGVSNGLTIASNGTVLTHVFNGGNVGVGNTAPAALLHVGAGADVPTTTATIYASLAGAVSAVLRDSFNDVEAKWTAGTASVVFGAVTNHPLSLHTNNTERVTVLAGGNVGVGNTAPAVLLHVGAGADVPISSPAIYASTAGQTTITVRDSLNDLEVILSAGLSSPSVGTASNNTFHLKTNNTEKVSITGGGNVGVGNTAPTALLHVGAGADVPATATATIYASLAGATSIVARNSTADIEVFILAGASSAGIGTVTNHQMGLYTNNLERITILANGFVGIGTSPSATLDVNGTIQSGSIQAAYNTDTISYFGRAAVGYNGTISDAATFAHIDQNTGNSYALYQGATGLTIVNASTSQSVGFAVNGTIWTFANIGGIFPQNDDLSDLGAINLRWDDIFATNGTIQTSDLSRKEQVQPCSLGLDFIRRLEPIQWIWKNRDEPAEVNADGTILKPAIKKTHVRPHFGLAGQQVKAVIDELGTDFAGHIYDPERDEHSLRYSEFIGPLVKAVQELTAMVESQANRLAELEGMKS